jgi:hypothetical protein
MNKGSILSQRLGDGLGAIVAESIVREVQGLKYTELRCKNIMDGLSTLESDFISTEVEHS